MKGYTEVCGEATLQGDRASVIVEIAQDVRAIGDILHDMAASSEEGTTEVEPREIYLLSDALGTIAEALDRIGGDA